MRKFFIIITIFIVSKYSVRAQNSYSLDFDGGGDYVEIIDESAMIANTDQMTLSGWVYPRGPNADSWTQFDGFFGFRNNNDADFYLLQLGAYKVEGRLRVSGGGEFTIITAENSIISETWHHLALTYNGSNIILYIDGIEAGSTEASGQITNESVPLKIGSLAFDNTNFDLDGQVDEVSLWNLALTEQEIQNYMYAEPTGEEGLLGYWNFNEGSGETANDASGNENHGSIYGATWSTNVPFQQSYSGPVWHVDTSGSNSTGDGSEENPFNTIQHGLNSAYNGDTVLVAEGTYSENVLWPAKNGITLIGSGEENCIIDGGSLASVMRFEEDLGGIIDTTTLIRGFTITNGYAQGGYPQNNGGGIYCFESSPTLMNVTVTGNSSFTGGGIYCWSNSNPLLKDVTVTGNSTDLYGGGIYCYESSPDLSNVTITGNSASDAGGGFYCYNNSGPTLTNVTISDNMASDAGGGFYCASFSGPSLMNSIFWNNLPQEIYFFGFHEPCSITVSFSDIQGGEAEIETNGNGTVYWEEGNLDSDPLFCNPDSGDYTLAANSPVFGLGEGGANMGAFGVGCEAILSIDKDVIPLKFVLHQNYPNPFNPTTQIRYDLPEDALVAINIYDLMGRSIKSLLNSNQSAGYRSIQWNATNNLGELVSAGMYIYMIQAGQFRQVRKMVLLK
jgi:parallel beta-helix repeat protein